MHEAKSELEREGNCARSPLLRPSGMIFLEDAKNESANVAHEDTVIAEGIFLTEEGDELESGVRVADDDPSDDGARDGDDVDHGCCCLRHSAVALLNDCSGHELENSSQDDIFPEEFGNKPEVVFSPGVPTCPSLAAGLERDETVERNEQSDDKQDACHDLEDTGIEMESEESNLPNERVEGPGEKRTGIGNVTNPGMAVQQEETL